MRVPSESVANASIPRSIDARVPAIGLPADRDRLGRAFQWARPADSNAPDLRQNEKAVIKASAAMLTQLWIGDTVVAVTSVEAGIARRLPLADALKECLKRAIYARHPARPAR